MTKGNQIQLASKAEDVHYCYHTISQLRPHLSEEAFVEQVKRQIEQGYHLAFLPVEKVVKCVAGYRYLEFLAWGKVLYIDDLVTDQAARGNGYAGTMLKWLIEQAKASGCHQLHLDSGQQRHDAHRLYLNHRLKLNCHHFALDLAQH